MEILGITSQRSVELLHEYILLFCSDYVVGITCVGWYVTYAEELL